MASAAWKALSDEPGAPDPDDLDWFDLLPLGVQRAYARGELTIPPQELIERLTRPESDLCPRCAMRPQMPRVGLCRVCVDQGLRAAHREYVAECESTRERTTARQQSKRAREALGIPAQRGFVHSVAGLSCGYGVRRDGSPTLAGGTDDEGED